MRAQPHGRIQLGMVGELIGSGRRAGGRWVRRRGTQDRSGRIRRENLVGLDLAQGSHGPGRRRAGQGGQIQLGLGGMRGGHGEGLAYADGVCRLGTNHLPGPELTEDEEQDHEGPGRGFVRGLLLVAMAGRCGMRGRVKGVRERKKWWLKEEEEVNLVLPSLVSPLAELLWRWWSIQQLVAVAVVVVALSVLYYHVFY